MKITPEILAEAVEACLTCDGNGWRKPLANYNSVPCLGCRGTGQMLTDEGHELIDFLVTWLKPKFAESDHGHSVY